MKFESRRGAAGKRTLALAICVALAGCVSSRSDLPYAPEGFDVQPDDVFADLRDYRIGPSDLLTISVYRVSDISSDYRVDATGTIMMPLVGRIDVTGMTSTEAADAVATKLAAYYVNPDVSVALKEMVSQRITVDGSVSSPGIYPIPPGTTLMQAVAMARGVTGGANLRRIVIFRQINGQRMAAAFDLRAIREAEMDDPTVYASDIIIVDGNETRQALRDVLMTIPILGLFRPFVL